MEQHCYCFSLCRFPHDRCLFVVICSYVVLGETFATQCLLATIKMNFTVLKVYFCGHLDEASMWPVAAIHTVVHVESGTQWRHNHCYRTAAALLSILAFISKCPVMRWMMKEFLFIRLLTCPLLPI